MKLQYQASSHGFLHCYVLANSLSMKFGLFHQLYKLLFLLPQLVAFFSPLLLGTLLDVLLKDLLALLRGQQQVAWVKHDLVQLLFPGGKCWNLSSPQQRAFYTLSMPMQKPSAGGAKEGVVNHQDLPVSQPAYLGTVSSWCREESPPVPSRPWPQPQWLPLCPCQSAAAPSCCPTSPHLTWESINLSVSSDNVQFIPQYEDYI